MIQIIIWYIFIRYETLIICIKQTYLKWESTRYCIAILYQKQSFALLMTCQILQNSFLSKDRVSFEGVWRLQQLGFLNDASFTIITIIQQLYRFQVVTSPKFFCVVPMKDRRHYLTNKYCYNFFANLHR